MAISALFRRTRAIPVCATAYDRIVAQARRPGFYLDAGVPDSVDGRFDLIALHAFLVMRRLKSAPGQGTAFSQALFDLMFEDMDRNLREMGAGDLGVGRRVKAMAKAFYGRVAAYEDGLSSDPRVLATALQRNLYRDAPGVERHAVAMAGYVAEAAAMLEALPEDRVMAGAFAFPPPPAAAR